MSNPLTKRLVVRLSADLEQWISSQAEAEGLDTATFARAVFTRLRNGYAPMMIAQGSRSAMQNGELVPIVGAQVTESGAAEPPASLDPANPSEIPDIDAMVTQSLDLAQSQGLMDPKEQDQDQPGAGAGVRPLFKRPTPFTQALPNFIK